MPDGWEGAGPQPTSLDSPELSPGPLGLLVEPAGPRPPLGAALACLSREPQKSARSSPVGGVSGLPRRPARGLRRSRCGPHERGRRGATGPRGRERAAAASSSLAPARSGGGGASPPRSGFKRRHPTPRRTRRSGAARACRCHASARAACARAPAAAPGSRRRRRRGRGRGGRRRARAPAARAAPLDRKSVV